MNTKSAIQTNGIRIRYFPDRKLGEGVDKIFYETQDPTRVIGFYKSEALSKDAERKKRLEKIIAEFNPTLHHKDGDYWKTRFCWPESMVEGSRLGFVTPRIPDSYFFNRTRKEKKCVWYTNPRLLARLSEPERGDIRQRLMVCRNLAQAVGRLHNSGLAHSDLSGNNVLLDPSNHACLLIDVDSLVVPDLFPPDVLGTTKYMAPELVTTMDMSLSDPRKNLPNINTDLHSLAVILYEMLLLRHPLDGPRIFSTDVDTDERLRYGRQAVFIEDPQDDSNRLKNPGLSVESTGPDLAGLFVRAFSKGLHSPDQRPTALDWEDALTRTQERLIPCAGNGCWRKWFVFREQKKSVCPYCHRASTETYPIMKLFRRYDQGRFKSENHFIVVLNNKTIHPWHIRGDVPVPTDLDRAHPICGIFFKKENKWFFQNKGPAFMLRNTSFRPLFPQKEIQLNHDTCLRLSGSLKGKLAVFQI